VSWGADQLSVAISEIGADRVESIYPRFNRADTIGIALDGSQYARLDRSGFFLLHLQPTIDREFALNRLRSLPQVLRCGPNERVSYRGQVTQPNDPKFKLQWNLQNLGQFNGQVQADVRMPAVWKLHNEALFPLSLTDSVAIVDGGVESTHPDLPNVVGMNGSDPHATGIAGIAAGQGNNGIGVAGMSWHATVESQIILGSTAADAARAIDRAVSRGFRIINASWGFSGTNFLLNQAVADAYKANCLIVAAAPTATSPGDYPGIWKHLGVMTVSATTNGDLSPTYGIPTAYVDVAAPGGNGEVIQERDVFSTSSGGAYGYMFGTSASAPHVAAAAQRVAQWEVYDERGPISGPPWNDDLRGVVRFTADDLGASGWDQIFGQGRINVYRAYENFTVPADRYTAASYTTLGPLVGSYLMSIYDMPGLAAGQYRVFRRELQRTVTWSSLSSPMAWGRGNATRGWPLYNADETSFNTGWCEVVPGTLTSTGCVLRTYVYDVRSIALGTHLLWAPCEAQDVIFGYTARRTKGPQTPFPDPVQSYFVPQSDSVQNPTEGAAALEWFRTCPNNDLNSPQILPHNARIKVLLKDGSGVPIAGVGPTDIFVLLNGGSGSQGFSGAGPDSVIANSEFNPLAACPDLRVIEADASTDAAGATYITFRGSTPGNPGVATRDASRKWGHYDSELPVYALGVKLQGRLTSGDPSVPYVLHIKNLDNSGGLSTAPNSGELIDAADINPVQSAIGGPYKYWLDFDSNGIVNTIDLNFIKGHNNHRCNIPSL